MKRILSLALALMGILAIGAQNISVVNSSNETTLYRTLDEAIEGAEDGSVIYLPAGLFSLSKIIYKKLTIMGVTYRGDTDNAEGATIVSGTFDFGEGSSGSSVMGIYCTGDVNIGYNGKRVDDFVLRYCNVGNAVICSDSGCLGTEISQCIVRYSISPCQHSARIENNIVGLIYNMRGGVINHNVITNGRGHWSTEYCLSDVYNCTVTNNFFLKSAWYSCSDNEYYNNLNQYETGENSASWEDYSISSWDDVFVAPKGAITASDYRIKEGCKFGKGMALDGLDVGITPSFSAVNPIPRIISKKVAEQTDGSGQLKIEVTVKAN